MNQKELGLFFNTVVTFSAATSAGSNSLPSSEHL